MQALAGADRGGLNGGAVSIFTTKYRIKPGPNYEDRIDGLKEKFEAFHETVGPLARTQEEFRKLAAEREVWLLSHTGARVYEFQNRF